MVDPRKFRYNSDYPMPFMVLFDTYDFSVSAYDYSTQTIAHGLPFTPLLVGQWSTNSNFNPSYDLAIEYPSFSGGQPPIAIVAGADSTNIYLYMTNNTNSTQTFYFRLSAFVPPNYAGLATAIDDNTPYKFNTDFNYMKIYMAGSQNVPGRSDVVVNHNLGYIPQTRLWRESTSYIFGNINITSPMNTQRQPDGILGAKVTASTLTLGNWPAFGSDDSLFYYHIYADGV